jgi:hypothetical protein
MDIITTQGKLREATIARANDVFPDPELPAYNARISPWWRVATILSVRSHVCCYFVTKKAAEGLKSYLIM